MREDRRVESLMVKLASASLLGAMIVLATPAQAARIASANGNLVMSNAGQVAARSDACRHQRCEGARCKPCKLHRGWFAEGLDPLIR